METRFWLWTTLSSLTYPEEKKKAFLASQKICFFILHLISRRSLWYYCVSLIISLLTVIYFYRRLNLMPHNSHKIPWPVKSRWSIHSWRKKKSIFFGGGNYCQNEKYEQYVYLHIKYQPPSSAHDTHILRIIFPSWAIRIILSEKLFSLFITYLYARIFKRRKKEENNGQNYLNFTRTNTITCNVISMNIVTLWNTPLPSNQAEQSYIKHTWMSVSSEI